MIHEARRSPRRQPAATIAVTDTMAETVIGRLGNLSETGLLLLASAPLHEDALYQLTFSLTDRHGREQPLDVGVHLLWLEQAHAPTQQWAGFRFLTISDEHRERLREWIAES